MPLVRCTGPRRRAGPAVVATALAVVFLFMVPVGSFGTPSAGAGQHLGAGSLPAAAGSARAVVPNNAKFDWPELHQTPLLTGFAYNSPLNSTNASSLGVAWATNVFGAALDSPVAAYDPILNETLAYIGTESGNVEAVNVATGQIVWGVWLGAPVTSSPLVDNGSVYVGTFRNPAIFRLNATTGATQCSVIAARPFEGSPTVATPPGGVRTVYFGGEDSNSVPGPMTAMNAANCSIEWKYSSYNADAGTWDPAAYALTLAGVPLVIFGTSDPDSAVYAVNALNGTRVWRFQAYNPGAGDFDVGAGAVISPPGKNGFAQGVAYVPSKYGIMYALNLNNGTPIWSTNFFQLIGGANGSDGGRSTPALDGTNLIFGTPVGLMDLNASTGQLIWNYRDTAGIEVISSPAIAGGHGTALVAVGDLAGKLDVVSVTTGAPLYNYSCGGYLTASPAVLAGNILVASSNGFLYDFATGGGDDAVLPTTSIHYPTQGATLPNPNGNLTIAGSSTDPIGVAAVMVGIQSGGPGGPWWDSVSRTWVDGPFANAAQLVNGGSPATNWSFSYPVSRAGDTYAVTAYAESTGGQSDIKGNLTEFAVNYSTTGPHVQLSSSYVGPGARVTVNGGGFGNTETVTIDLGTLQLTTVRSTSTGALPAKGVKIPATASFGQAAIVATGQTSGRSAAVAVTIENSWEMSGFSAGLPGYEPNDPVLNFLIHPGGNLWVQRAWYFVAGGPIDSSPAIVDGVAYIADSVGDVFAVDIQNGGLLWTWTLPSGAALNGAPAVDPPARLLFVGTNDGNLEAISTASHSRVWNASLGGDVGAPIFNAGRLYVTSTNGQVAVLNESTGSRLWSLTLPSTPTAPSLNVTQSVLVIGQGNGNVTALNAATGSTLWSYATGSSIKDAALVSGGVVYFGATNGKVYALAMATGTRSWSFTVGGAVDATPVISHHYTKNGELELLAGSSSGLVVALRATDGHFEYNMSVSGGVVGLGAAEGVVLIAASNGQVTGARTYVSLEVWHYRVGTKLECAPVIVDGTIYIAGNNGNLDAFTSYGQAPD